MHMNLKLMGIGDDPQNLEARQAYVINFEEAFFGKRKQKKVFHLHIQ